MGHKHKKKPASEGDAYTIAEFCQRHRISEALYYKLASVGQGPRVMHAGRRTLISKEAAADWRRAREGHHAVSAED